MGSVLIFCIRLYQRFLSPALVWIFGPSCRFMPTCSEYAIEAIRVHGMFIGGAYAVWRILRCHPFARGGYDPVPDRKRTNT